MRAKICEVVARLGALHVHIERPDSVAAKLYGTLIEGLMYLTSCGTPACTVPFVFRYVFIFLYLLIVCMSTSTY